MVNASREEILDALESVPKLKASQLIKTGFEAAKARSLSNFQKICLRSSARERSNA